MSKIFCIVGHLGYPSLLNYIFIFIKFSLLYRFYYNIKIQLLLYNFAKIYILNAKVLLKKYINRKFIDFPLRNVSFVKLLGVIVS